MPCEAFCPKLPLDDVLSGYPGMVRPRQPQDFEAFEPLIAAEYVLESVVESMAYVELAGNVRRRDDDGVGRFRTCFAGSEKTVFFPIPVPTRFELSKLISFRQSAFAHTILYPVKGEE
jgi:hypothetical protein